jgi:hypothetical protein
VNANPAKRLLAHGWLYVPAVSSPIGGGMIKIGGGSTWAAVIVGTAPYAICSVLCLVFVLGYLAAVFRYLCAEVDGQEAMARLIRVSADAIVSILTLTHDTTANNTRPQSQITSRSRRKGNEPKHFGSKY